MYEVNNEHKIYVYQRLNFLKIVILETLTRYVQRYGRLNGEHSYVKQNKNIQ